MQVRQSGTGIRRKGAGISRRSLLVGGLAAGGLALAWATWPRSYAPHLRLAPGETAMGAFLKIDRAGQIIVLVPQTEMGQGIYTVLPQILADELGADWRTVAVQPAVPGPLYVNHLLAREWLEGTTLRALGPVGDYAVGQYAERRNLVLTGGSTSVRAFRDSFRDAGAAARVLLCKAAGARWNVAWESLDIIDGIVSDGTRRLTIGALAEEAAGFDVPEILPLRQDSGSAQRLIGTDAPRLDIPSKIDGSANFAADIRLPEMVFASIRQGPVGDARLVSANEAAARRVTGVLDVIRTDRWVAVTGTNWWAANQGLGRLDPVFEVKGDPLDDAAIERALADAMASGKGERFFSRGDLSASFDGASIVSARYRAAPALHLAIEPLAATARVGDYRAEIWVASQAPGLARAAVADALGLGEDRVTIYPLLAGGSFGRRMEVDVAVQAALIARQAGVPVQLQYARSEDIIHDRPRAPAIAWMSARMGRGGRIDGWLGRVAAPAALAQSWRRTGCGDTPADAIEATGTTTDRNAVSGMDRPYQIANFAVDHHPARVALPAGHWRSNADHYGVFFSEAFCDELAAVAMIDPMSFRIQMLGGNPRLAHCLTTVAALGGWQGGTAGSGQGIACHSMAGSHIALLVDASVEGGRIGVRRMVAAVDCGEAINPDIVRQQIEGGLIFGLAAATGGAARYSGAMPTAMQMGEQALPGIADVGEIMVELIASTASPGGVGEIGVPCVAPALAGALHTLTGRRFRTLPLTEDMG